MDLEGSGRGVRISGSRVMNKIGLFFLGGGNNLLGFFGMFSSFQTRLRAGHENLGSYFILYAIDKPFVEERI
jgi:hypothetical protein